MYTIALYWICLEQYSKCLQLRIENSGAQFYPACHLGVNPNTTLPQSTNLWGNLRKKGLLQEVIPVAL